ncbi:MAG TPA: DUF1674 domain-containing protein [Afifellaceae bacterium]|nr:DUF1674 domain-containing protein [Afifellaceae bacterium]
MPQPTASREARSGPGAEPPGEGGVEERRQPLAPAAERALAEAAARRAGQGRQGHSPPEEGGRGGPDPARYGEWEVKGRAVDF